MTVKELKERLSKFKDEDVVTVDLAPSGHLTACGTVEVKNVNAGFDWESGQCVLKTKKPVDIWFPKCQNCRIPSNETRISSRVSCLNLNEYKYETQVLLDGKVKIKIPFTIEHKKSNQ